MKALHNLLHKELLKSETIKGAANGKGTKQTAAQSKGKPQLL